MFLPLMPDIIRLRTDVDTTSVMEVSCSKSPRRENLLVFNLGNADGYGRVFRPEYLLAAFGLLRPL